MSDAAAAAVAEAARIAAAATPWFATADDELKGWLQTRGLDKREAPEAVFQLAKDLRETQSKLSIPADRVLRVPEATDEAGWTAARQRFGVPADPAEYDFSAVKAADGAALPDDMVAFLRATAAALATPKDRAPKLAEALLARAAEADARRASASAIESGQADLRLRQNWGPNYRDNLFYAERFMARLGLPAEIIEGYKNSPHYDKIMEAYRAASTMTDEATLIGGNQGGGQARISTREQAAARIEELIRDADFYKRRMTPGDPGKAAREEWAHLHNLLVQRT